VELFCPYAVWAKNMKHPGPVVASIFLLLFLVVDASDSLSMQMGNIAKAIVLHAHGETSFWLFLLRPVFYMVLLLLLSFDLVLLLRRRYAGFVLNLFVISLLIGNYSALIVQFIQGKGDLSHGVLGMLIIGMLLWLLIAFALTARKGYFMSAGKGTNRKTLLAPSKDGIAHDK